MKRVLTILSLLLVVVFTSCENVQDNQTSVQATVDGQNFNALYVTSNTNIDGSVDIETSSDSRTIKIHLSNSNANSYNLDGSQGDYATYTDVNGNVYTTQGVGSGLVSITDRCEPCGTINGRFDFIAVMPGIDTVQVNTGMFVDVVIGGETENPSESQQVFTALLDTATFNPMEVNTIDTGNFILIEGKKGGTSIIVRIPITAQQGDYNIVGGGFNATLVDGMITENANNGSLTILNHNTDTNSIRGTFEFQVGSSTICAGIFDVKY